jgi:hypothetical protein
VSDLACAGATRPNTADCRHVGLNHAKSNSPAQRLDLPPLPTQTKADSPQTPTHRFGYLIIIQTMTTQSLEDTYDCIRGRSHVAATQQTQLNNNIHEHKTWPRPAYLYISY